MGVVIYYMFYLYTSKIEINNKKLPSGSLLRFFWLFLQVSACKITCLWLLNARYAHVNIEIKIVINSVILQLCSSFFFFFLR